MARFSKKKKKALLKRNVWFSSTNFVGNIPHSMKNWASYDQKCILFFMWSTSYACQILTKLQFSHRIFEKYSSIKFHENPSSDSWVFPCGQTDRHTEGRTAMTKLIVAFRKFTTAPNKHSKGDKCLITRYKQFQELTYSEAVTDWTNNTATYWQQTSFKITGHEINSPPVICT